MHVLSICQIRKESVCLTEIWLYLYLDKDANQTAIFYHIAKLFDRHNPHLVPELDVEDYPSE